MKRFIGVALVFASLCLPSFAASNSSNLTFLRDVKIGAQQLPAGEYKISWTGSDANVQVTISKKGKSIATMPAKQVPANNPGVGISTKLVDGASILESIQLQKFDLVLSGTTASGE